MQNLKFYKRTLGALALAFSLVMTGCGAKEKEEEAEVVTEMEENEKDLMTFIFKGQEINVGIDKEFDYDNVDIRIKNNDAGDGYYVFIDNLGKISGDEEDMTYGFIMDVPSDNRLRGVLNYYYTSKKVDDRTILSIYEIDEEGNKLLNTTYIYETPKRLTLESN